VEFILFWLLCPILCAAIGSRHGEGLLGFVCGLIFGPLGIIFVLLSKGNRKHCPFCKELVNKKATVCPHCQKELPPLVPLIQAPLAQQMEQLAQRRDSKEISEEEFQRQFKQMLTS
jgi:hypothetical protein